MKDFFVGFKKVFGYIFAIITVVILVVIVAVLAWTNRKNLKKYLNVLEEKKTKLKLAKENLVKDNKKLDEEYEELKKKEAEINKTIADEENTSTPKKKRLTSKEILAEFRKKEKEIFDEKSDS